MKMPWIIALVAVAVVAAVVVFWFGRAMSADMTRAETAGAGSLYDLKTNTLEGEPADLGQYRGKVALVVNTASKCGLTPQYEGLEALYQELAPEGFVVLGFPSNDFMGQEPGSPEEIRRFCTTEYPVTFPLFEKSKVKGGDRCEVYQLLAAELEEPTWNFTKYVVDREGVVVARFGPRTTPDSPRLRDTIERELAAD
jgi:glutathione peroxidase